MSLKDRSVVDKGNGKHKIRRVINGGPTQARVARPSDSHAQLTP